MAQAETISGQDVLFAMGLANLYPPSNQMIVDIARNARQVVHGAMMHAIREIEGHELSQEQMMQRVKIATYDGVEEAEKPYVDMIYKGEVLLRVWEPVFAVDAFGRNVVSQKIDECWKKNKNHIRMPIVPGADLS